MFPTLLGNYGYPADFAQFQRTNPHCPSVEKQKISGVW